MSGPQKKASKYDSMSVFAAVDNAALKNINTSDSQDSWNRFASKNQGLQGLHRGAAYTQMRHQPAFPKLGDWKADPSGINDGRWTGTTNQHLVEAAEANRRKKIWEDEQKAAKSAKRGIPDDDNKNASTSTESTESASSSTTTDGDAAPPAAKKAKRKKTAFNPKDVFMSITIDGVQEGSMHFRLFDKVVPRTAANFRALCAGNRCVVLTSYVVVACCLNVFVWTLARLHWTYHLPDSRDVCVLPRCCYV